MGRRSVRMAKERCHPEGFLLKDPVPPDLYGIMTTRPTTEASPPPATRCTFDGNDIFFLTALLLCSFACSGGLYLQGWNVTPQGPSFAIAETAKSIWENGSLSSTHARAVFEAAQALSRSDMGSIWQDVFAMDVRGNLVAKHSIISSLIAAPFYGIFGKFGFWLCQQLFFLALSFSVYRCGRALSGAPHTLTSLLAICLFSPALVSSYTFGYDLHGVAFLMGGLCLSRSRPLLGGMALACAVSVRPSHILLVAPLIFAWFDPRNIPRSMRTPLGALAILILILLCNVVLWGGPLTTAYSRLPRWESGVLILDPLSLGFERSEFIRGWSDKLFGGDGLFSQYGTILTIPCAIWMSLRSTHLHFFRTCLVAATINILYVFSYPMWDPAVSPNRFLHPSTFLFLIPFTVLTGRLEMLVRTRFGESV
jgi:hypothetical protein